MTTKSATSIGAAQAHRLETVYEQLAQTLSTSVGAQPLTEVASDTEWSVMQVLGHMAEMIPYWLDVCQRIIAADGPLDFGRSLDAPERLAGVERGANATLQTMLSLLQQETQDAAATIRQLSDAERSKHGINATRGKMTVGEIVETMIVSHAESHLAQIRALLPG